MSALETRAARALRCAAMLSFGVRGLLGVAVLCTACGSSGGGGSTIAAAGSSNMTMSGGAGGTGGAGTAQGQQCMCNTFYPGQVDCSGVNGCVCFCQNVPCTTDGGLQSTQSCHGDACDECTPKLAEPTKRDFALQQPADEVEMAPDGTTYVVFGGFPNLGHYDTGGGVISVDVDVPLDSLDWDNTSSLLVAPDGTLYSAVRVGTLVTTEHDTAVILHGDSNGKQLARTAAAADVVSINNLVNAPGGKIYALGASAMPPALMPDTTFVAEVATDGTLGTRVPMPVFGFEATSFAVNAQGDIVLAGLNVTASGVFSSRIALLPAGGTAFTDLYDASHDEIGDVLCDPAGGWWFSTATPANGTWVTTLYHTGNGTSVTKAGELTTALADASNALYASSKFALLSDSQLLINLNPSVSQTQSVARFADGKLIQRVDVTDANLIASNGKLSATVMSRVSGTSDPGFAQIVFEGRQ